MAAVAMQPVENALEAGLLIMRNGGSTVAAERTFANILRGSPKEIAVAVWRLDFAAVSRTDDGKDSTLLRQVGPIGVNLTRASAAIMLGERVARGEVASAAVGAEIERIKRLPSPYNRWLLVAMAGVTGACFSQIPGGDWGSLGIAFVAAAVGQFVRSLLQGRVAVAPVTLACGVVSALIASLGLWLGYSQAESATLVGSVIYVVPGLPLINGFVDMISHRHLLVGFERMMNAGFLFLILAIGIAFAHSVLAL